MTLELSEVLAGGALIFSAGGGWIVLRQVAKRGADQGRRIGKIEIALAEMRGMKLGRALATAARGIPQQIDEGGEET